jgi:hypothetical protein
MIFGLCLATPLLAGDAPAGSATEMVPLVLKLPSPVFAGTPKAAPAGVNVEPDKPGAPIQVPKDAHNIAPKAKLTCSDRNVTRADLAKITDGDKEAEGDAVVELKKGLQWIQFDFGSPQEIDAIAIWHAHDIAKIFRCVIAQAADDQDFTVNVKTLYNNDRENTAGMGVGTNRQYFETFRGKTIDGKGIHARFVRLYSDGSTDSKLNEYTEVEIYGRPAK